LFEKELPKYNDILQSMYFHPPFEAIDANKEISHIFKHFQN
jgi:hypothetical protein